MKTKNKWVFAVYALEAATVALTGVLVVKDMPYTTITVLVIGGVAKKAIEFFDLKNK